MKKWMKGENRRQTWPRRSILPHQPPAGTAKRQDHDCAFTREISYETDNDHSGSYRSIKSNWTEDLPGPNQSRWYSTCRIGGNTVIKRADSGLQPQQDNVPAIFYSTTSSEKSVLFNDIPSNPEHYDEINQILKSVTLDSKFYGRRKATWDILRRCFQVWNITFCLLILIFRH